MFMENYITINELMKNYIEPQLEVKHGDKPSINEIFKILNPYYTGGRNIDWLIKNIIGTIRLTPGCYKILKNKIHTDKNYPDRIMDYNAFLLLDIREVPEALLEAILIKSDVIIEKTMKFG